MTVPFAAIDPMALILPTNAYLIWLEIHHPHVPAIDDIRKVFERMTKEERAVAVARARSLAAFGKAVEEVAG